MSQFNNTAHSTLYVYMANLTVFIMKQSYIMHTATTVIPVSLLRAEQRQSSMLRASHFSPTWKRSHANTQRETIQ